MVIKVYYTAGICIHILLYVYLYERMHIYIYSMYIYSVYINIICISFAS